MSKGGMAGDPEAGDAGQGQSGEGGDAGSGAGTSGSGSGSGGASGNGALGGMSGSGGSAGAGGGTGGTVPVPAGWTCLNALYEDGAICECGCGIRDPDCDDETRDSCDVCRALGSCSITECPGTIVADDNSKCALPPNWACDAFKYGDGSCDCGCNALDVDCPDASPASCDACPASSCTPLNCDGTLLPDDNTKCLTPPSAWRCAAELWNDGVCHCGCRYLDPDCDAIDVAACDVCDAEGSCSNPVCPGVINRALNWQCLQPQPPTGWTCLAYAYGDNNMCDCGCGVRDVDCGNSRNVSDCDRCVGCGDNFCNGTVDPADISQCLPPPEGWICDDNDWGDFFCDCGCGVLDSDCAGYTTREACYYCPAPGCAMGDCEIIDPVDNTVCR
jgi:hypothetical protein